MGVVVPFDRGRGDEAQNDNGTFLGSYSAGSKFQIFCEEAFFALGVFGPPVAAHVTHYIADGSIPLWFFVVLFQTGVIVGLIGFIWRATFASIIDSLPTSISRNDSTKHRKAS